MSQKQKNGKAPGQDNIPPESLKNNTDLTANTNILSKLFEEMWKKRNSLKSGENAFYLNYKKKKKELSLTVQIGEHVSQPLARKR
jgi:hypothetical protein